MSYLLSYHNAFLHAVYDCLHHALVIPDNTPAPIPDRPGLFYAQKQFDQFPAIIRKPPSQATMQREEYATPCWQVVLRPIRPDDLSDTHLFPSVFLRMAQGIRSASGRGLQDGRQRNTTNQIAENFTIGIQAMFRDGYGAVDVVRSNRNINFDHLNSDDPDERNDAQTGGTYALPLSQQINGFIHDLDKCLNAYDIVAKFPAKIVPPQGSTLTPTEQEFNDAVDAAQENIEQSIAKVDTYITDWVAQDAFDGSGDQIVSATLHIAVNFRRKRS